MDIAGRLFTEKLGPPPITIRVKFNVWPLATIHERHKQSFIENNDSVKNTPPIYIKNVINFDMLKNIFISILSPGRFIFTKSNDFLTIITPN